MLKVRSMIKSKWFRTVLVVKIVVKVLILMFVMNSCMTYEEVQFQGVDGFKIDKVDKDQVKLRFNAKINNPNDYNISVKATNVDLGVNGKSLARASTGKKVVIKKNTSDSYPVEVTVKLKDLLGGLGNSMMNMFTGGSLDLTIKGDAKVSAKGLSKKFPIEFTYPVNPQDLNMGGFNMFK